MSLPLQLWELMYSDGVELRETVQSGTTTAAIVAQVTQVGLVRLRSFAGLSLRPLVHQADMIRAAQDALDWLKATAGTIDPTAMLRCIAPASTTYPEGSPSGSSPMQCPPNRRSTDRNPKWKATARWQGPCA
jgi:hypothetical protein